MPIKNLAARRSLPAARDRVSPPRHLSDMEHYVPIRFRAVILAALLAGSASSSLAQQEVASPPPGVVPSLRQVLDLEQAVGATVSPDGKRVAFVIRRPDWEADGWTWQLLVSDGGPPALIHPAEGFRGSVRWSPDSEWLVYLARTEHGPALRLTRADGTAALGPWRLPRGTAAFEIAHDGRMIALAVEDRESASAIRTRELFGRYEIKGQGYQMTHLWVADLALPDKAGGEGRGIGVPRRLTAGDFTVGDFAWSPDGTRLAFDHAPNPSPNASFQSDISLVDIATGVVLPLVTDPGTDTRPMWSPDGKQLLYSSSQGIPVSNLPSELVVIPSRGGAGRVLTKEVRTGPSPVAWIGDEVWFVADDGMPRHLYRLNVRTGAMTLREDLPEFVGDVSLSADGARLAVVADSRTTMPEVYLGNAAKGAPTRITNLTRQVKGWALGTREDVVWQASDGMRIEGVLLKPDGFDPARRYPLMVEVHGGPRSISRGHLIQGGPYPIERWLASGALVLLPNYRGSSGYGPEFRTAHHRTAGFGDAMDVEAGVDHLIRLGIVDPERVGLMGWSYGGFISAWLTATSDRFRAISVGAGISDWRTHYAWEAANITTRVFTFGTTPWEDPETWAASSPITHIRGARTPTLIQHLVGDPVVSIISAYELYQALTDLGVETELVQYPHAAHYPRNPKSQLALAWQNWEWFARHLWGKAADRQEVVEGSE